MRLPEKELQKQHLQENIMSLMKKELITVQYVEIHCFFPLQSLRPLAAGLHFINQSVKTVLSTGKILLTIWSEGKFYAEDVVLIWDISSKMAQNQQENDSA